MSATRRVYITVRGRVQGVYFRACTHDEATRLGIRGWVRNLPDGRVEAVYEGRPESVEAMLAWTHEGSPQSEVALVEVEEQPPEGLEGFEIRR